MPRVVRDANDETVGLADALFPGTRQKVLGSLFGEPERAFSISELIENAHGASGSVQREVRRLVASGLVRITSFGRHKQYQANPDAPIFDELRSIVRKVLGPAERLRLALSELGNKVDVAILYGSVAKHTDRAESDIDVLLVSDALTLEDVFRALAPAESELGREINPTLYTKEEFNRRRETGNAFLSRVLSGPYITLKGSLNVEGSSR